MIDAKTAMLSAHPNDLVDHVEARLWNLGSRVLLTNELSDLLVFAVFDFNKAFFGNPAQLLRLFLIKLLVYIGVRFHGPIVVLMDNVVAPGKFSALLTP